LETHAVYPAEDDGLQHNAQRPYRVLRAIVHRRAVARRSDEDDVFDFGALVERVVARERHAVPDPRVSRVADERRARPAV